MTYLAHITAQAAQDRRARLYAELRAIAAKGAPCPRNETLAPHSGFRSPSGVARALRDLADEGLIEIERRNNLRRITICATGDTTAAPPSWTKPPVVFQPKRPVREIAAKAIAISGRPAADILGRSRFREHVRVRQVIFAFAVREGWPHAHAGRVLGYDHSTVCHARKVLGDYAKREPATAALIDAMKRELPPLPERTAA